MTSCGRELPGSPGRADALCAQPPGSRRRDHPLGSEHRKSHREADRDVNRAGAAVRSELRPAAHQRGAVRRRQSSGCHTAVITEADPPGRSEGSEVGSRLRTMPGQDGCRAQGGGDADQ
jgi:hypothetical protein